MKDPAQTYNRKADRLLQRFQTWRSRHPKLSSLTLEEWWEQRVELGLVLHTNASLDQAHGRFREDDGSETTATWRVAEDADATGANALTTGTNYRIRFSIEDTASGVQNNVQFQLFYQHVEGTNVFTAVTATSSVVQSAASIEFTDGVDTTAQLTDPTGGSGSFITPNGGMDDTDGIAGDANLDFVEGTNDYVEVEFCFQIVAADVSDGDTINFRVEEPGGTDLESYSLPDISAEVDKPVSATSLTVHRNPIRHLIGR